MKTRLFYFAIFLLIVGCTKIKNTSTRLVVGLSIKKHKISKEEIIEIPQKYFNENITIGKFRENYYHEITHDTTVYRSEDNNGKRKFKNFIVQPLNCMFFNETDQLIAAYSICDAELQKSNLTWTYYLLKKNIASNINIKHNFTFQSAIQHIDILKESKLKPNAKNVIVCWSKIGGRQTKNYFKEFSSYLSNGEYNIYVINCDDAINKYSIQTHQK